jgi:hypothetical protein
MSLDARMLVKIPYIACPLVLGYGVFDSEDLRYDICKCHTQEVSMVQTVPDQPNFLLPTPERVLLDIQGEAA